MIKALIGELKNYLRAFSLTQGLLLLAFAALSVGLNHYYHIEKQLHQLDFSLKQLIETLQWQYLLESRQAIGNKVIYSLPWA